MRAALERLLILLLVLAGTAPLRAQTYKLKPVGSADGLTNSFVHALAQDATGRLWIGTGEGAGRYDGRQVTMYTTADSLSENFVASIHPAKDGCIWFGHNEGGISRYIDGVFHKVNTADITSSSINAIIDDGNGGIWAAAQNNGIIHVSADGTCRPGATMEGVLWYSLLALNDGLLLAGASDGLHLLQISPDGTLIFTGNLSNVTRSSVNAMVARPGSNRICAGTGDEGVISFSMAGMSPSMISSIGAKAGLGELQVRDLAIGAYGQLIVGTFGQGAYEIDLQGDSIKSLLHYDLGNGLGSDNVDVVFPDTENNLWFARFGLGLARLLDRSVVYYAAKAGSAKDVRAIAFHGNDVWFGIRGAILHALNNDMRQLDTLGAANGIPPEAITALIAGEDGRLCIGTATSGALQQDATGHFKAIPTERDRMSLQVHALAAIGDETWIGTSNGVYVISTARKRHLTTENGLLHNEVNALFKDALGRMWIACNNGGVSMVSGDEVKSFTLTEQGNAFHVSGIAQDSTGRIWFSTNGSGLRYLKDDLVMGLGTAQGLQSDYCYAIAADGHGGIWTCHRGGASRIDRATLKVRTYDRQFGLEPDRRMNTVAAGPDGDIWFGSDKGMLRYATGRDIRSSLPPTAMITAMKVSGKDWPLSGTIELPPDDYRLQFDFLGTSLRDPDAVRYRYMLEGHDLEWTETSQNSAYYMRIADGRYVMLVQAAMAGGDFTGNTARLQLYVGAPIWKRPWFITASIVLLLFAIYGIIRLRERSQRLMRELLKRKLDERTHELQRKKEELEEKNKDITDSITYARRIQQAILPQVEELEAQLPGSFVFYRPRDIVSGDFYWFRRSGNKIILACADCTGHGVPGALMSMIGGMLLREVSVVHELNSPDVLLRDLDNELRAVLQYQADDLSSHDGMDISLCEFDMATKHLRASAAMHDLLILSNGKLRRERGTRHSIGGALGNDTTQVFSMIEAPLEAGDRVYLFSDGIQDQFGGPQSKKLKVSGLFAWIEETATLPMAEQAEQLRLRFDAWIGDQDQVDDVLLIGIEM
ncbi:MAG: SpoIIE family protein phosphatase [Flavobacteriales bacterium]|nr:SpoIIE family protein phosphatase [Flavobacteriales bacterium]